MCVAFAVCAIKKLEDCSVKCWNRIALCPISLIPPALAIGVLSLLMEFVIVAEGCPNESVTWGGAEWHSVTFLFWFGHFKTFLNSDKTFFYRHNYEKLLIVLLEKPSRVFMEFTVICATWRHEFVLLWQQFYLRFLHIYCMMWKLAVVLLHQCSDLDSIESVHLYAFR